MLRLLQKEIRLAMHPTVPIFLLLSAMLLIPNYPYYVAFFYTGLGVFFTCMNGREQHDIAYTLLLPVCKRDVVRARMLLVTLLELLQLALAVPFLALRSALHMTENAAGMEANIALLGLVLLQYGIFNLMFFGVYYRNVRRVGVAFLWSCAAVFLYIGTMEVSAHTVPFFRDVLDTPDPQHLGAKLLVLLGGAVAFSLLTLLARSRAIRAFERQDL